MSGVVKIYLSTISKKKEVKEFLQDLGQFINRDDFNIDHDFYLNLKDDQIKNIQHHIQPWHWNMIIMILLKC